MTLTSNPLPSDKQTALDDWLKDKAFDILLEVMASGQFEIQLQALEHRALPADTKAQQVAERLEEQSRSIGRNIEFLTALRRQKEPFTITTATP